MPLKNKKKIYDFIEFTNGRIKFIPLLFGKHQGLLGYKMRPVDKKWILSNMK